MRFAIAAGVIAQALPITSKKNVERNLVELIVDLKEKKQKQHQNGRQTVGERATLSRDLGFKAVPRDFGRGSLMETGGQLVNKKFSKTMLDNLRVNHKRECDPQDEAPKSAKPDVGILGCGDHQYCMESRYSKLGGFCVGEDYHGAWDATIDESQRALQSNSSSVLYGCSELEVSGNGTSYTCTFYPFCAEPCFDLCVVDSFTYYRSFDNQTASNTSCYDFYEPITTQLCYTYNYTDGGGPTCALSYAGQDCASCKIIDNCTIVDCSNVQGQYGPGSSGNTCFDNFTFPVPFYQNATYGCLDYCDICSGGNLANPNATIPFVNRSCLYAEYAGSFPYVPDDVCGAVQTFAFDACGCEGGNAPFFCSACPDDGMITNPDVEVNLTLFDVGVLTCADVQLYAPYISVFFGVDMYVCPFFQATVAGPCGCQVPMTPAPAEPMTPAPVEPMTPAPMESMTPAPAEPMTPAPMMTPTMPTTPTTPAAANPTTAPMMSPTEAPTSDGSSNLFATVLALTLAGVSTVVATVLQS